MVWGFWPSLKKTNSFDTKMCRYALIFHPHVEEKEYKTFYFIFNVYLNPKRVKNCKMFFKKISNKHKNHELNSIRILNKKKSFDEKIKKLIAILYYILFENGRFLGYFFGPKGRQNQNRNTSFWSWLFSQTFDIETPICRAALALLGLLKSDVPHRQHPYGYWRQISWSPWCSRRVHRPRSFNWI